MKVTLKGITRAKELLEKSLTLDVTVRKVLTAATAERLRTEAHKRSPVRTGELRDAGRVVIRADDISYTNPTGHAEYCEFGTGRAGAVSWQDFYGRSRLEYYIRTPFAPQFTPTWPGMRAMPFVRPAIVVSMDALVRTMREVVQGEME